MALIFDGDGSPSRKTIQLSATNYGPTDITLHGHVAKRRQGFLWLRRNRKLAALINAATHPDLATMTEFVAPNLPQKLAVGERVNVYFPTAKRWVEEADLYYFGFSDTFGRLHWCSRANARKFRADLVEEFGAVEPHRPGPVDPIRASVTAYWKRAAASVSPRIARVKEKLRRNA